MKRTHTCGALRKSNQGQSVTLVGWIDSIRDHGGILFVDLRDREGLTQVLFDPHSSSIPQEKLNQLKDESVIEVTGKVKFRSDGTINHKLETGAIEVAVAVLIIHNISDTIPFPLEDEKADKVNEDLRLAHRYLDLRRPRNLNRLQVRHRTSKCLRDYMDAQGFLEVETPILFKSTPEGAREFLVPSRLNPNQFYALTQSPQQYKQMLMVAGVERYYSMARCFRDEDLRSDRQPEFTQLDLEMSFIDREDIYALLEGMMQKVWKTVKGVELPTPFPRIPFKEAMDRFGSDKPDTRFTMEIEDFTKDFSKSGFKVFASVIKKGGVVKAFNAKGLSDITQGELRNLEDIAKMLGAKGLAFIRVDKEEWKSPILKFFSEEERASLQKRLQIEAGDMIFFAATHWEQACTILGRIRLESANLLQKKQRLKVSKDKFNFLWVVNFPLMTYSQEEDRFEATHHPFTAPVAEDIEKLESDPAKVRGQHYDLVLNGVELGGGSIRVHQPDLQKKVFETVLKIPKDVVESRFGYLLKAFRYGAPPHGGIAIGFDRLCAILSGTTSIRDVIAFPKTQKGQDLMNASPSPATKKQLSDLNISITET